MELRWVALNWGEIFGIMGPNLNRFRKCLAGNINHLLDKMTRLDQDTLAFDATRESEHLPDDTRTTSRTFFNQRNGRLPIFVSEVAAKCFCAH